MEPIPILPPLPREEGVTQIERFLEEMVRSLAWETPTPTRGRPKIIPSLCLWLGILVCLLRGARHQRDLWRLLAQGTLWSYPRFPVTDQAVYARLERDGVRPLQQLFDQVRTVLQERLTPVVRDTLAPFATEVVALDETTLDHLTRRLPTLREAPSGSPDLVGGTLAGLFDLRRQQWRTVQYRTEWQQNEKVAARSLVDTLPRGSLILADLGYFGFAWFDDLTAAGHWWISRMRQKTSSSPIHVFYRHDQIRDVLVFLGTHRSDRAATAVRLIEFQVGSIHYRYITNVTDPHLLSMKQVAELYARRWDFELAVDMAKTHLGLHLLWSSKAVVIQQQVLATLILAQILHALRLEIAYRAGVDPFEVSLQLLIRYLPQFAARGLDPVDAFLVHARELGFIRPSTRTTIRAPVIPPEQIIPAPPDLVLTRPSRHAHANCGPMHDRSRRPS